MVQELSFEEIKKHNDRNSTWLVINNDVYDVTEFLNEVRKFSECLPLFDSSPVYAIYI